MCLLDYKYWTFHFALKKKEEKKETKKKRKRKIQLKQTERFTIMM